MTRARRNFGDVISEGLGALEGRQLLDVGCGQGARSRALAALGAQVVGAEPDPSAVLGARHGGGGPRYVRASATALPFEDASFDVVCFCDSLHHVPAIAGALAEAHRVCRPGGSVVVLEPEADDPGYPVFRLLDDERAVYEQAQACIDDGVRAGTLQRSSTHRFATQLEVKDFDELVALMRTVDSSRRFDADALERARAVFEEIATRTESGRALTCHARLDVLRRS